MTTPIEYGEPIGRAWDGMRNILFRPFDSGKWFVLGFTAWLASLGQGGSFNFNIPLNTENKESMQQIGEVVREYLPIILAVGAIVLLLAVAFGLVFLWLSCRGRFMFLDNVLHNRAEVAAPWREFREQGNSLFGFNLVFGIVALVAILIVVGLGALCVLPLTGSNQGLFAPAVVGLVLCVLLFLALVLAMAYVMLFLNDFVVVLMHRERLRVMEAWHRFGAIYRSARGSFLLYGVVRFGIGILMAMAVFAAVLLTCCCLACIMMIPLAGAYLGIVVLLPIYVFDRLLGPEFLSQFLLPDEDICPPPLPEYGWSPAQP